MRRALFVLVVVVLVGCGGTTAVDTPTVAVSPIPAIPPTANTAATATRDAELSQIATLSAPTSTATPSLPTRVIVSPANTPLPTLVRATNTGVPPTMSPAVFRASGPSVRVEGKTVAVTLYSLQDPAPWIPPHSPQPGNRFIAIDIAVENISQVPGSYNAAYAYLKMADNRRYEDTVMITPLAPDLSAGKNASREVTRGWVEFEVPANSKIVVIGYQDSDNSIAFTYQA